MRGTWLSGGFYACEGVDTRAMGVGATVGALQNSMVKEVNIATRRMDNSSFWLIAREFSPVAAGTQQFASVVCQGTSQNVGYSEPIVTAPGRLSPMLVQPPLAPKHRRLLSPKDSSLVLLMVSEELALTEISIPGRTFLLRRRSTQEVRMQRGSLVKSKRKQGPEVWQFRWSEKGPNTKRVYRRRVIGTDAGDHAREARGASSCTFPRVPSGADRHTRFRRAAELRIGDAQGGKGSLGAEDTKRVQKCVFLHPRWFH